MSGPLCDQFKSISNLFNTAGHYIPNDPNTNFIIITSENKLYKLLGTKIQLTRKSQIVVCQHTNQM